MKKRSSSVKNSSPNFVDALTVKENERENRRQSRYLRATILLSTVTAVFIVSWIPPYMAMVKAFYIGYSVPMSQFELLLNVYGPQMYVINNFANPIIFALMSSYYRKNVAKMFTDLYRFIKRKLTFTIQTTL